MGVNILLLTLFRISKHGDNEKQTEISRFIIAFKRATDYAPLTTAAAFLPHSFSMLLCSFKTCMNFKMQSKNVTY